MLDVTAGGGALALPAEHVDVDDLATVPDGAFDVVASAFGVIHAADMRPAAAALWSSLRPGARLGLATWSSAGAMGTILRSGRTRGRPERWGSYEGLMRVLDRFPSFEVSERELRWDYPSREAIADEFPDAALEPFVTDHGRGCTLVVAWCLVRADRPG